MIFFQAEDGIRDLTVTGVQTCALPISFREPSHGLLPTCGIAARNRNARRAPGVAGSCGGSKSQPLNHLARLRGIDRSEERRVGKEWRSRWSPDHLKK